MARRELMTPVRLGRSSPTFSKAGES